MNRNFFISRYVSTPLSPSDVLNLIRPHLSHTTGNLRQIGDVIYITQGTANVDFSFMAELEAAIQTRQSAAGVVEVTCQLTLKPNSVFWVCLFLTLCTLLTLIVPVLFYVCDPRKSYDAMITQSLTVSGLPIIQSPPSIY